MENYFGENEVVLVHGTGTSPATILKKGFDNVEGFWNCSEYNQVYCYEYERWCKCEGYDPNDNDCLDIFIHRANEQGQIQNAIQDIPGASTSVLEFHFPEEFKEFIETDESYPNMSKFGSVQVNMAKVNEYMQKGKCKVIVHKFPFSIKSSLLYLTSMVNNPYADSGLDKLPDYERQALDFLAKGEFNDAFYEECISWPTEITSYEPDYPLCSELGYTFP